MGRRDKQLQVKSLLGRFVAEQLKQHITQLDGEFESMYQALTKAAHRHGELTQQLATMLEDRKSLEAYLRLAMVQQRLEENVAQWKLISAITKLLNRDSPDSAAGNRSRHNWHSW